jgi:hypothetical protein
MMMRRVFVAGATIKATVTSPDVRLIVTSGSVLSEAVPVVMS